MYLGPWGLAGSCAKRGKLRWSDIFVVSSSTTLQLVMWVAQSSLAMK